MLAKERLCALDALGRRDQVELPVFDQEQDWIAVFETELPSDLRRDDDPTAIAQPGPEARGNFRRIVGEGRGWRHFPARPRRG